MFWPTVSTLIAGCVLLVAYIVFMPSKPLLPPYLEGNARPPFKEVVQVFRKHIESGFLTGGAFAVYHRGELVVDLYGGYSDIVHKVKWKPDTLTTVFSVTKSMSALSLATLIDKGYASYDDKISKYWPEFAANGKEEITLRTLLAHRAGLVLLDEKIQFSDLIKPAIKKNEILVRQKPIWTPGSKQGYHVLTFGLYLDEIIARIDPKHRDVQTIFKQEIAEPLGLESMIGLSESQFNRKSIHAWHSLTYLELLMHASWKNVFNWYFFNETDLATRAVNCVENYRRDYDEFENLAIPWSSGTGAGTAKSLAKMISLLTTKGRVDGKQILSENVVSELLKKKSITLDETLQFDLAFSLGLMQLKSRQGGRLFGHLGFGGQFVFADIENEIAVGFTTNQIKLYANGRDPRMEQLMDSVYDCLEKLKTK